MALSQPCPWLGSFRQSSALLDITEHWTEEQFHIESSEVWKVCGSSHPHFPHGSLSFILQLQVVYVAANESICYHFPYNLMLFLNSYCIARGTEQVGSSSNASELYVGCATLKHQLSWGYYNFPQFLHANSGIVPEDRLLSLPSTAFPIHLFSFIWLLWCTIQVTDSIII